MTVRGAYGQATSAKARPKTLGERIRRVRLAWGWTQTRLAEEVGGDQRQVSLWETDVHEPSRAAMNSLAQLMGMSVSALKTGKGFSIPDVPFQEEGKPSRRKRVVPLPPIRDGECAVLTAGAREYELASKKEALQAVREHLNSGNRVWILFEENSEP